MIKKENIAFLDILKFVAAICISCMLHFHDHFVPAYGINYPFVHNNFFYYWSTHGWIFVEMFFITSELLFYYSYMQKIKNAKLTFYNFFTNRALRLYPLVIITSLYMYILQIILDYFTQTVWSASGTLDLWVLFSDILFCGKQYGTSLNAPLWYTNALLLCLLVAFLLTKLSNQWGGWLYTLPIIIGVGIKFTGVNTFFLNTTLSRGYISFFIGILLGFIFTYSDKMAYKKRAILIAITFFWLVIMITIACSPYYSYHCIRDFNLFASFMLFPELFYICYNSKFINKICGNKIFKYLGKISFGIYVWNFPIYITLYELDVLGGFNWNLASKYFWIFVVIIHIFVGIVSYNFLEKKIPFKIYNFFEIKGEQL